MCIICFIPLTSNEDIMQWSKNVWQKFNVNINKTLGNVQKAFLSIRLKMFVIFKEEVSSVFCQAKVKLILIARTYCFLIAIQYIVTYLDVPHVRKCEVLLFCILTFWCSIYLHNIFYYSSYYKIIMINSIVIMIIS